MRTQNAVSRATQESCERGWSSLRYGPGLKRRGESGAGRIKAIIWTLILAALAYVGFKVTPILINEYEFQDDISNLARASTINRHTPEQIRDDIMKIAQKDDVPAEEDDIKVQAANGNVKIDVNYSVTIDLTVYQWTLNLHPVAGNDSIV